MKVAFLHNFLKLGGVETVILNLCQHMDRSRVHAEVFCFQSLGPLLPRLTAMGTAVHLHRVLSPSRPTQGSTRSPRPPAATNDEGIEVNEEEGAAWDRGAFQGLVQALRGFDVAVTFYGGGEDTLVGVRAAEAAGVTVQVQRVAWTVVPRPDLPLDALELASNLLLRLQVEAQSPYRLERIATGVDLSAFRPSGAEGGGKEEEGEEEGKEEGKGRVITIGCLSRLVWEKNPASFVYLARYLTDSLALRWENVATAADASAASSASSAAAAPTASPTTSPPTAAPPTRTSTSRRPPYRVRFVLAGSGAQGGFLRDLASRLGAVKHYDDDGDGDGDAGGDKSSYSYRDMDIEFVGEVPREEVPSLLSKFDVFVYPTLCDSFGNVIAEAMAMALPIVTTAVCAVPELMHNDGDNDGDTDGDNDGDNDGDLAGKADKGEGTEDAEEDAEEHVAETPTGGGGAVVRHWPSADATMDPIAAIPGLIKSSLDGLDTGNGSCWAGKRSGGGEERAGREDGARGGGVGLSTAIHRALHEESSRHNGLLVDVPGLPGGLPADDGLDGSDGYGGGSAAVPGTIDAASYHRQQYFHQHGGAGNRARGRAGGERGGEGQEEGRATMDGFGDHMLLVARRLAHRLRCRVEWILGEKRCAMMVYHGVPW